MKPKLRIEKIDGVSWCSWWVYADYADCLYFSEGNTLGAAIRALSKRIARDVQ